MENEEGFFETPSEENDQNKIKFFYKGNKNNWENYLSKNEVEYILNELGSEMKELGYI